MGDPAEVVKKIIDLLPAIEALRDVASKGILVFKEQRHGDSDFKPIFSEQREQLIGGSLPRPERCYHHIGIEDHPPLLHDGIIYDTDSAVKLFLRRGFDGFDSPKL